LIVDLRAGELTYISVIANRRHENKRNVRSKKWSRKTEFGIHYEGVMTEYAVRKHFELGYKDLEELYVYGDDGVDVMVCGWSCHVKKSVGNNAVVNQPLDDWFTAPVGIFVKILSPTRLEILGCISKKKFEKLATEKDYGYGPRLQVPKEQLSPVDVLVEKPNSGQ
jgi:hypothetical protein